MITVITTQVTVTCPGRSSLPADICTVRTNLVVQMCQPKSKRGDFKDYFVVREVDIDDELRVLGWLFSKHRGELVCPACFGRSQ